MSRLGKLPIKLLPGVQMSIVGDQMVFKGPKGELKLAVNPMVSVKEENGELLVAPVDKEANNASAMWGLIWSLVRNANEGVGLGFTKKLEINGVGYRAAVNGNKLNMSLGFSHPIDFTLPEGVSATVTGNTISLTSADKVVLGETAANIRKIRKPEPYKGKGVKYSDEIIRRKAGKAAAKGK